MGRSPAFDLAECADSVGCVLKEFLHVKQESGAGKRRWFESDGFELVVWFDAQNAVTGYQICYDFGSGEHALTWRPGSGFSHSGVDDGEGAKFGKMTPILVPDGAVPWGAVEEKFARTSGLLEPRLREVVGGTLAARR
jgi:hypothetical protein